MVIEIFSGKYSILSSGIVLSFSANDEFEIKVTLSESFNFSVIFIIIENGGERNVNLNTDLQNNNVTLTCYNFKQGAGTTEPIEIATFSNKKIYITFWIESVDASQKVRSLKYTIFMQR